MQSWLDSLNLWHWFALAVLLLAGEWMGAAGYLLGAAVAALLVGLVLAAGPAFSWTTQLFLFATFAVVFTLLYRKQARRFMPSAASIATHDASLLVGQTFVLDHSLPLGHGRLQVGEQSWQVHCTESLAAGHRIKVIGMDGAILKVIPLKE